MLIEILVFSRDERLFDQIGQRLGGHEQTAFARKLSNEFTVAGIDAGRHRRCIVLQNFIVGQVLAEIVDVKRDKYRNAETSDYACGG